MNTRQLLTLLPYAAIVAVASLVGLSLARVDPAAAENQLMFGLTGALIATASILIARSVFGSASAAPFPQVPRRKLRGLKVGVVGFCIALLGWLVGVFLSRTAGFAVAVLGIAVGFVGMGIHFMLMFSSDDE
jgi:hypothetical protein